MLLPVFPGPLNMEISYGTFLAFFVDLRYQYMKVAVTQTTVIKQFRR